MQKLKLQIESPCQEDWENMSPAEQGKFCQQCAQIVVDFSAMNDEEVLHFLIDKKNTFSCCRLNEQQEKEGFSFSTKVFKFPPLIRKIASIVLIGVSITGFPILVQGQDSIQAIEVDKEEIKSHDKIIRIEVPAEYETIEFQRLIKPAQVVIDTIAPAEYTTIHSKRLTRKGGSNHFLELYIRPPEESIAVEVKLLKEKLKEKGYYEGKIDNVYSPELEQSILDFKKDHKQIPSVDLDKRTLFLLELSDSPED